MGDTGEHREVVEIIVRGVGGETAEEILGGEAVKVGGDKDAGFYRPASGLSAIPVEGAGAAAGEAPWGRVEAYDWGRLTSGSRISALWWLMLPFSLMNLAGWTLPATGGAVGNGAWPNNPGRRSAPMRSADWWVRGVIVFAGTLLTFLLVAWLALVAIDVVALPCGNLTPKQGVPCADRGVLKVLLLFVEPTTAEPAGAARPTGQLWQGAVGFAVAAVVWFTLAFIIQRSQRLEWFERDPARRSAQATWPGSGLDYTGRGPSRLSRNTALEHWSFWYQWQEYVRLWRWHTGVAALALGLVAGLVLRDWTMNGEGVASAALMALVVLGGVIVVSRAERVGDVPGEAEGAGEGAGEAAPARCLRPLGAVFLQYGARQFIVTLVVALVVARASMLKDISGPGDLPNGTEMLGVFWLVFVGVLALYAIGVIALLAVFLSKGASAVRQALVLAVLLVFGLVFVGVLALYAIGVIALLAVFLSKFASAYRQALVLAVLSVFVIGAGFGGLTYLVGRAVIGRDELERLQVDTVFVDLLVAGVVLTILIALVRMWLCRRGPGAEGRLAAVAVDYPSIGGAPGPLSHRERLWVRRVRNMRDTARLGSCVPEILLSLVVLVVVAQVVLAFLGLFAVECPDDQQWPSCLLDRLRGRQAPPLAGVPWMQWLHGWASTAVVLFLFPGLQVIRLMGRGRGERRQFGKVWDVVGFWPRRFHPMAAPCYAERAVPELRDQIQRHLAKGRAVLLSTHSQGSVVGFAALCQIAGEAMTVGGETLMDLRTADPVGTARYRSDLGITPDEDDDWADLSRIGFVTYGSPLSTLYGPNFPAHFGTAARFDLVRELLATTNGGSSTWRNFYRPTDYVGRRVFVSPGGVLDPPDPNADMRLLEAVRRDSVAMGDVDPATLDPRPAPAPLFPPESHSNYDREPTLQAWLLYVRDSLAAPPAPPGGPTP